VFARQLKIDDLLLNKYRIERILGRGGFGCAYLAQDIHLPRKVVIKELRAEYLHDQQIQERFRNEACTMASLDDPRIVRVIDFVVPDPSRSIHAYYIVMEYMAGGSLDDWLLAHSITVAEAVRMSVEVCLGLEQAHSRGVVHRDIKPGNILLSADGKAVKVGDWGLAHIPDTNMTMGGQPGTLRYMAVEQALGSPLIDGRCDLYSVGAMLFNMVTGDYYLDFTAIEQSTYEEYRRSRQLGPTDALSPRQQLELQRACQEADCHAIIYQPVRRPRLLNPDIPPRLEGVILKALAKKPADRYETADEMAEALRSALRRAEGSSAVTPEDRVALWLKEARQALGQSAPSDALRSLEKAQNADPRQAVIYCEMARCYHLMQRPEEALRVLEEGLRHAPNDACLQHDLGVTYMHLNQPQDAIEALERSLRLDPSQPDINKLLKHLRSQKRK
jgi:serine/threonine protein kinase